MTEYSLDDVGVFDAGDEAHRATAALATLFFITSMALAWFAMQVTEQKGLMDSVAVPVEEAAPEVQIPVTPQAPTARPSEVPVIPQPSAAGSGVPEAAE